MTKDEKYLIKEVTLTRLVKFLNDEFKCKKNCTKFKIPDVQAYISRGNIPSYLGGNIIESAKQDCGAKLYNVLK